MDNPYYFFDMILCITLENRKDRQESSQAMFSKLNIPAEFFYVQKHPEGGKIGCFTSHIECIKKAYNAGANNLLVFEDDVRISKGYKKELISYCVEFMKNNDWEMFKFGYGPAGYSINKFYGASEIVPAIIQHNGYQTHAYSISKTGMERVLKDYVYHLQLPKKDISQIDVYYENLIPNNKVFAIIPIQFDQHWCLEFDNEANSLFEGIFRNIQCVYEKYQIFHYISTSYYYKYHILALIVITIMVVVFMIWKLKSFKKGLYTKRK